MQLLVNVDVDDIERGIDFYHAAFGLHLGRRLFGGSVAGMLGAAFAWGQLAMLSDPFGHGFCLLQFTGRGYDAVARDDA